MSATADMILERRRLRRRLSFWRILAILALVIAALALVPWSGRGGARDHVAQIDIEGVISDDRRRTQVIRRIAENDRVKALVVRIASPGGTVVGSEAIYEILRDVAEEKPVVAVVGELAASGGYIAAMGADHVIGRHNSIVGSVGVIAQVPNVTGLLDQLGVKITEIKSAPLKAAPSPVTETDPAALDALEVLILDSFDWFRDLVGERRGLEGAALDRVTDGRVFTGHQAIDLGLVDEIGDTESARNWLETEHGIATDLPVRSYGWENELPFPFGEVEGALRGILPAAPLPIHGPRVLALYTG